MASCLAEKAKEYIGDVPLAFGPRLSDPWEADKAIANGVFDFWEICRPLLSDPELIHKIRNGQPERVKPCIGCMLCLAKMFFNQPYICAVNPRLGHEVEPEYKLTPAVVKKKVMVTVAAREVWKPRLPQPKGVTMSPYLKPRLDSVGHSSRPLKTSVVARF